MTPVRAAAGKNSKSAAAVDRTLDRDFGSADWHLLLDIAREPDALAPS